MVPPIAIFVEAAAARLGVVELGAAAGTVRPVAVQLSTAVGAAAFAGGSFGGDRFGLVYPGGDVLDGFDTVFDFLV